MSVTISIPTALRQFAGGTARIEVEAKTAGEALDELTSQHAELRRHLYNDKNTLRSFVNVYVNDEDIRHQSGPSTPVKDGDTLIVLFGGGTKRGQQRDIVKAKELLTEYKVRKKAITSKLASKHKR